MKYIYILLLAVAATLSGIAQTVKIVDRVTNQPIDGFTAICPGNHTLKADGQFDLPTDVKAGFVVIWATGYKNAEVNVLQLPKTNYMIYMESVPLDLMEVVISANRTAEKKVDIPQQIEIIKSRDIQFGNPTSSGEMLSGTGNVFVQTSQYGGSSPVLRGFEANRVLLVVDGVRMNNAIYRGGHLQNVITVDPNILDRTEVIFGPGSSIYGSDALGGVMHFYSKKPMLATGKKNKIARGEAMLRYGTAAGEKAGNVNFNFGWRKFASLTSISVKNMNDVMTGSKRIHDSFPDFGKRTFYVERINGLDSMIANSNVNKQVGSGYGQLDITQKFLYRPSKYVDVAANFQYSNSTDVPRYDRLSETVGGKASWAEWYYGPQTRMFTSLRADFSKKNKLYDHANIIVANQKIQEDRIQRRYRSNNRDIREETVVVNSINLDLQKQLKAHNELRYGIEVQMNDVTSNAKREDISKGTFSESITSRYPSGENKVNYTSAYLSHRWESNKKIIISDGIRINRVSLNSTFSDSNMAVMKVLKLTDFEQTIRESYSALSGNLGFVYNATKALRISFNGSTGFKAPNLDDVNKFMDSRPGGFFVVPNRNLKPEYSYNTELGISYTRQEKYRVEATFYYTRVENLIAIKNTTVNGMGSIVYDGVITAIQSNQNLFRADVLGVNINGFWQLRKGWVLYSTINYTKGTLNKTTSPLDHIPPAFGKTGIRYETKKLRVEFYSQYNGWKKLEDYRLGAEDNEVYATSKGSPSWYTINMKVEYSFAKHFRLQTGVENILDQHYRAFASGFSAPGRNIYLALRGSF